MFFKRIWILLGVAGLWALSGISFGEAKQKVPPEVTAQSLTQESREAAGLSEDKLAELENEFSEEDLEIIEMLDLLEGVDFNEEDLVFLENYEMFKELDEDGDFKDDETF